MKIMNKFYVFGAMLMIAFLIGTIGYFVSQDAKVSMDVNGTRQYFPIKIDSDYEVIDAKLNQYEITVILKDVNTNEIYESTLPSDDIESLVCGNEYSEVYDMMGKGWDCSTEDKAVESMIREVADQTIELIKEGL